MTNNKSPVNTKNFEDCYQIGKVLGYGSFSVVYLGVNKQSGDCVAVKIMQKALLSHTQLERAYAEIEILSTIKHEHIVNLIEYFDSNEYLFMVLELCTGGELFDKLAEAEGLQGLSEAFCRQILTQTGSAVYHLHRKGMVHRDLKPENLLFRNPGEDSDIALADFGFAKRITEGETLTTPCGTPGYVAPEIANSESYKKSVDMWSLGVVMYTLLCGFPPFYSEDDDVLLELIAEGAFSFPSPYWDTISQPAKDLVKWLLEKDPVKRCTAEQFLNHPWFKAHSTSMDIDSSMDCDTPPLTPTTLRHSTNSMRMEGTSNRPRTPTPTKHELKSMFNKVMAVQRDGTILRSASESLLWKRRQKGRKTRCESDTDKRTSFVQGVRDVKRMSDQSYLN